MGRYFIRTQLDIVPRSLPTIPAVCQKIEDIKDSAITHSHRSQIECHESCLRVHWIEAHDGEHHVCAIVGSLAIGHDLRVVRGMKDEILVSLQRRIGIELDEAAVMDVLSARGITDPVASRQLVTVMQRAFARAMS